MPRGSFGRVKKGFSICFNYSSVWWSPTSLGDLKEFERRTLAHGGMALRYHLRSTLQTVVVSGYYLALKLGRGVGAAPFIRKAMKRLKPDFQIYEHNHPRYGGMAFLWALSKVTARYPAIPRLEQ